MLPAPRKSAPVCPRLLPFLDSPRRLRAEAFLKLDPTKLRVGNYLKVFSYCAFALLWSHPLPFLVDHCPCCTFGVNRPATTAFC